MALNTKLSLSLNAALTASVDKGTNTGNRALEIVRSLLDGTGAGQADRIYVDDFSVAASSNTDLDLAGSLADGMGGTASFARVKLLVVVADILNANNVVVGAAASNPWIGLLGATHTLTLRPGAAVMAAAGQTDAVGYATVAGTGDLLRIANSGAGSAVTGSIAVVGCSA